MDIQRYTNHMINHFLIELVRRRGIALAQEDLCYAGTIRWREVPFESREEYAKWWLPETQFVNGVLKIMRAARMGEREKDRYTVHEDHNILTTAGRSQVLTFMGSQTSNTAPFAQYFAIGNFPINKVDPGDTAVQSELFRSAPSTTTITGTQLDIATFIPQASAQATYTNVGLLGVNAVATLGGAGTLMTHALSTYTKGNVAVTGDYLLNLQ